MSRRRGLLRSALAVLLLATVVGSATLSGSPHTGDAVLGGRGVQPAVPEVRAVSEAELVCPGPEQQGLQDGVLEQQEQRVEVLAATAPRELLPPAALGEGAGTLTVRPLDDPGSADAGEDATSTVRGDSVRWREQGPRGVRVTAEGALAPGLAAQQTYLSSRDQARGLALTACAQAAEEVWLVAGGGEPGRSERLVVQNPGTDAVTVAVRVLGADGAQARPVVEGVVVPGGGRVVSLLDALAPGVQAPVVHVSSTGGEVAAFLGDRWLDGTTDRGAELTGPVAAPSTTQVVPGVRVDDGAAAPPVLRVAVPGEEQGVVQVRALGPDGPVALAGEATLVGAGRSADLPLADLPPGDHVLVVQADVPVVASALLSTPPAPQVDAAARLQEEQTRAGGGGGGSDIAWAAAGAPVTGIAGLALPAPGDAPRSVDLHLVSTGGAVVDVGLVAPDGTLDRRRLTLEQEGVAVLSVGTARAVWVVSVAGEVHAAVTVVVDLPQGRTAGVVTLTGSAPTRTVPTVLPVQP